MSGRLPFEMPSKAAILRMTPDQQNALALKILVALGSRESGSEK